LLWGHSSIITIAIIQTQIVELKRDSDESTDSATICLLCREINEKNSDKRSKREKHIYHVIRLLSEAKRIVNGLEPVVSWEINPSHLVTGPERDFLLRLRTTK